MADERMILLVEGEDDEHVVLHLYREVHSSEPPFTIENKENYTKLLQGLPVDLKRPGLKVVGILADADDNVEARWLELTKAVKEGGRRLPDAPAPSGTIVEGRTRVGVWLMPDNGRPGELEDFVLELVPSSDRVWPLAERYIDGIPDQERKFKSGKILKAKLYAWLASRRLPQRMGASITAGDLDVEAPLAQRFARWLSDLFGE